MRTSIFLIFTVFCLTGCRKTNDVSPTEEISMDTIYSGNFIWREKEQSKRLYDNGTNGDRPVFKLNEENFLRIRVKRLFEYEIFPSEIHGAEFIKVDTAENLFLVTPTDTSFSFVINQYYPKGRVIRCVRNWNNETNGYDEELTPLNGFKSIIHFERTIK